MNTNRFFDAVVRRAPFADRQAAERAVSLVLDELAELLAAPEIAAVAAELPEPLARQLKVDREVRPTASGFLQKVAAGEQTNLGFAREHVQVILQQLCEELSAETAGRLVRALPHGLAEMAEPREPIEEPPPPAHPAGDGKRSIASGGDSGRTLASARPGSRYPVSEAHPEPAHRDSVARSDEPHADRKLSSGAPSPDGERSADR